ncbi:MAG: polymorphic toxin type 47 domain-containing protein [Agriterribacter sp.]
MRTKVFVQALIMVLATCYASFAQRNPYKEIGKKAPKVLSLTNGEYEEFFDDEDVQQIGTSLINIRTGKIVKLLTKEESEKRLESTMGERFLSVDPLASKYPMLSPYQYASNSPISGVDLDGLEYVFYGLLIGKDGNVGLYKTKEEDIVYQVNFIGTTHTGSKVNIPQKFSLSGVGIKERFVSDGQEVYHIPEGYDMTQPFPPPGDPAWANFTKYEQYNQDFLEKGNYYLDNIEYIADIVEMFPVGGNVSSSKNFRARMSFAKEEANAIKRSGWQLGKNDIDLRGKGKSFNDALEDAFQKTGVNKDEFKVTKWGKNSYGKSVPVEYRSSNGAEVNVDFGHSTDGPSVPHIGWQTPGKRSSGGGERGHILVDDVPAGRSDKKSE